MYFNATPYVHTVQTQSVSEVTSAVDKPTLQSDDAALTLKCRMFPQDNENAHYMRLTVERAGRLSAVSLASILSLFPTSMWGLHGKKRKSGQNRLSFITIRMQRY